MGEEADIPFFVEAIVIKIFLQYDCHSLHSSTEKKNNCSCLRISMDAVFTTVLPDIFLITIPSKGNMSSNFNFGIRSDGIQVYRIDWSKFLTFFHDSTQMN
jgi:hypothetical protein